MIGTTGVERYPDPSGGDRGGGTIGPTRCPPRRRVGVVCLVVLLAGLVVLGITVGANPVPLNAVWTALTRFDPST